MGYALRVYGTGVRHPERDNGERLRNRRFMLTCSEEALRKQHDRRGDKGGTDDHRLHLPPCPGDMINDTENKNIRDVVRNEDTEKRCERIDPAIEGRHAVEANS